MEQITQPIEANVIKCVTWVAEKQQAKPTSRKDSEYKRKDGKTVKTVDVKFSNGATFTVSAGRFWKKRE